MLSISTTPANLPADTGQTNKKVSNAPQQTPTQAPVEHPVQTPVEQPSVIVKITPGEENVSAGDKSQNTAQISVTTPNNTYSAEVSRSQVMARAEQQMKQEALEGVFGSDSGSDNALRNAALLQNGALGNDTVAAAVNGNMQQNLLDNYTDAASDSAPKAQQDEQSFEQKYQEASNAYIKQELFFSTVDEQGFSEKA